MEFRIADTFTDSLARLTGDEQKAVKTTAFDLQVNPASPGMSFHKLDKAKDKNFWSVRVSSDIRLIVHKTAASLLLCYVDHHDKAYAGPSGASWRRIRRPGAAQLVEIRETLEESSSRVRSEPRRCQPRRSRAICGHKRRRSSGYGVPHRMAGRRARRTRTRCLRLLIICQPRPPRHSWNSRPVASHRCRPMAASRPVRAPRCAAPIPRHE